jgi:6-pyruvoyltetrahydropterin/6-carboxytetrahydropterin synthase
MESSGHKIVRVSYQPTSEMMIIDFADKIKKELPTHLGLHHLILRETETSYAEWYASDQ